MNRFSAKNRVRDVFDEENEERKKKSGYKGKKDRCKRFLSHRMNLFLKMMLKRPIRSLIGVVLFLVIVSAAFEYSFVFEQTIRFVQGDSIFITSKYNDCVVFSKSPLMIAVVADSKSLSELGPVVLETWAKRLQENEFDIRFFVGSDTVDIPEAVKPYTINVKGKNEYPPRRKVFEVWNYLHDAYIDEYKLFLKVDIDSFLNVDVLKKVSHSLLRSPSFDTSLIYAGYVVLERVEC